MSIRYIYRCPYQKQCRFNKRCHALTSKSKLHEPLDIVIYCKPGKKELDIKIKPEEYEK